MANSRLVSALAVWAVLFLSASIVEASPSLSITYPPKTPKKHYSNTATITISVDGSINTEYVYEVEDPGGTTIASGDDETNGSGVGNTPISPPPGGWPPGQDLIIKIYENGEESDSVTVGIAQGS